MLGTLDRTQVFGIVEALLARDGAERCWPIVEELDERAPDYREVLDELAACCSAWRCCKPCRTCRATRPRTSTHVLERLAAALSSPEDAAARSTRSRSSAGATWSYAPDVRGGFEMTLLRMLAFRPWPKVRQVRSLRAPARRRRQSLQPLQLRRPRRAEAGAVPTPRAARRLADDGRADESAGHGARSSLPTVSFAGKQGNKVQLVLDADGEHFRRPQLEEKLAQALTRTSASRCGSSCRSRSVSSNARAPAKGGRRRSRAAGEGGDRERPACARCATCSARRCSPTPSARPNDFVA